MLPLQETAWEVGQSWYMLGVFYFPLFTLRIRLIPNTWVIIMYVVCRNSLHSGLRKIQHSSSLLLITVLDCLIIKSFKGEQIVDEFNLNYTCCLHFCRKSLMPSGLWSGSQKSCLLAGLVLKELLCHNYLKDLDTEVVLGITCRHLRTLDLQWLPNNTDCWCWPH